MKSSATSSFQKIVSKVAAALAPFPVGKRYLVGVSGGRDSVALLHLLHRLGYKKLVVCHLNHGIRGTAAAADANFVGRLCAKLGFDFETDRVSVAAIASEERLSIETAARQARYAFFSQVAKRRRCRTIFLAHHADDQVETFLFNLFRGTGSAGLAGMRPVAEREGLLIARPLLGVWGKEIDAFVKSGKIRFREDQTNADPKHARNRLRHESIPMLERQFGREITGAIWRACEVLGAENDWQHSLVPPVRSDELSLKDLRAAHVALQRRMLAQWLRDRRVSGVGFKEIESVRSMLAPGGPAKVNLPGNRFARRRAGKLFLQ